jgi:hypothetical protein
MTSDFKTKRLKDILARVGSVKSLTDASVRLAKLDRLLKSALPSLLADYCQVKACSAKELTIEAYSQAVATHLRFSTPKLLEKLQRHEELSKLEIITIRVGTVPQNPIQSTPPRRPNPVSKANCELLQATAASMDSEALRASLERLAATLNRKRGPEPKKD